VQTSVFLIFSYIAELVGDGTKVCMRLLLRRTKLSRKSRNVFWKFHEV